MKKILLTLLAVIVVIQFIRIDKSTPKVDDKIDFIAITQPADEVKSLLKEACYDCHSYETKYPWYTNVQPIGWWSKHHIDEGREELNFSEWGNYNDKRKDHKLEECAEEVEEGKMPISSYTWMHGDLTSAERKTLAEFFESLR